MKKKDNISFIGERELWIDFVCKVKKNRKEVWEVLKPMLEEYIRGETNG